MLCWSAYPRSSVRVRHTDSCSRLAPGRLLHVLTAVICSASMIPANPASLSQDGLSFVMARRNWKSRDKQMGRRLLPRFPTGPYGIGLPDPVFIFHLAVTLMLNKRPQMKLSLEEEMFLRHWMYDETHYQEGPGPAKRLQLQHRAVPADLAVLIAAAIPDPIEQEKAGLDRPSTEPPKWPWSEETLLARVSEARTVLSTESMSEAEAHRQRLRPRP
jgi:hypothetical protein